MVLPVVLGLLALAGLVLAPGISYAASGMNGLHRTDEGIRGLYAADAGIEYMMWSLARGGNPPAQLAENVNQMAVSLQTVNRGVYTVYMGEFLDTPEHNDYLDISHTIVWDSGAGAYRYTISVTWEPGSGTPTIHLQEVGARLPYGYAYVGGSAAPYSDNLSRDEPSQMQDSFGAYLINWVLSMPLPTVSASNPTVTQVFYITGSGSQVATYPWVVANREDVGAVGFTGSIYALTATATNPQNGRMAASIQADVMIQGGVPYVIAWQVTR